MSIQKSYDYTDILRLYRNPRNSQKCYEFTEIVDYSIIYDLPALAFFNSLSQHILGALAFLGGTQGSARSALRASSLLVPRFPRSSLLAF